MQLHALDTSFNYHAHIENYACQIYRSDKAEPGRNVQITMNEVGIKYHLSATLQQAQTLLEFLFAYCICRNVCALQYGGNEFDWDSIGLYFTTHEIE